MLLTTHTARRCPTVVGHWAIVGLPTLEPLYVLLCVGRIPFAETQGVHRIVARSLLES